MLAICSSKQAYIRNYKSRWTISNNLSLPELLRRFNTFLQETSLVLNLFRMSKCRYDVLEQSPLGLILVIVVPIKMLCDARVIFLGNIHSEISRIYQALRVAEIFGSISHSKCRRLLRHNHVSKRVKIRIGCRQTEIVQVFTCAKFYTILHTLLLPYK